MPEAGKSALWFIREEFRRTLGDTLKKSPLHCFKHLASLGFQELAEVGWGYRPPLDIGGGEEVPSTTAVVGDPRVRVSATTSVRQRPSSASSTTSSSSSASDKGGGTKNAVTVGSGVGGVVTDPNTFLADSFLNPLRPTDGLGGAGSSSAPSESGLLSASSILAGVGFTGIASSASSFSTEAEVEAASRVLVEKMVEEEMEVKDAEGLLEDGVMLQEVVLNGDGEEVLEEEEGEGGGEEEEEENTDDDDDEEDDRDGMDEERRENEVGWSAWNESAVSSHGKSGGRSRGRGRGGRGGGGKSGKRGREESQGGNDSGDGKEMKVGTGRGRGGRGRGRGKSSVNGNARGGRKASTKEKSSNILEAFTGSNFDIDLGLSGLAGGQKPFDLFNENAASSATNTTSTPSATTITSATVTAPVSATTATVHFTLPTTDGETEVEASVVEGGVVVDGGVIADSAITEETGGDGGSGEKRERINQEEGEMMFLSGKVHRNEEMINEITLTEKLTAATTTLTVEDMAAAAESVAAAAAAAAAAVNITAAPVGTTAVGSRDAGCPEKPAERKTAKNAEVAKNDRAEEGGRGGGGRRGRGGEGEGEGVEREEEKERGGGETRIFTRKRKTRGSVAEDETESNQGKEEGEEDEEEDEEEEERKEEEKGAKTRNQPKARASAIKYQRRNSSLLPSPSATMGEGEERDQMDWEEKKKGEEKKESEEDDKEERQESEPSPSRTLIKVSMPAPFTCSFLQNAASRDSSSSTASSSSRRSGVISSSGVVATSGHDAAYALGLASKKLGADVVDINAAQILTAFSASAAMARTMAAKGMKKEQLRNGKRKNDDDNDVDNDGDDGNEAGHQREWSKNKMLAKEISRSLKHVQRQAKSGYYQKRNVKQTLPPVGEGRKEKKEKTCRRDAKEERTKEQQRRRRGKDKEKRKEKEITRKTRPVSAKKRRTD